VSTLSRLFRIQPGEGRTVALVVAFMFLSVAGLTIGESGITALFFDRIGPDALPIMYLAGGAVGIAAMLALSAALGRFERRRAYVVLPLVVAGVVAVERAVVAGDPAWIYPVMWLTTTVAYLVEAVYLWGAAGLVTDTRRAKRLFPLFGAGGILGVVVGGLVTRPLASAIGAENLLVVWVVALTGASALCAAVLGVRGVGPEAAEPLEHDRRSAGLVAASGRLAWLPALIKAGPGCAGPPHGCRAGSGAHVPAVGQRRSRLERVPVAWDDGTRSWMRACPQHMQGDAGAQQ
jgi:hypothetical protein